VSIGYISRAGGINGEKFFGYTRVGKNQTMPEYWAARNIIAKARSVTNKPQLLARFRIVGISCLCGWANQLFFSIVFNDGRGGIRFAIVIGLILWGNLTGLV